MEKIKVIIAEDEPPIARFIKMLTEQEEDFLVTAICENGEDALKEVESSSARLKAAKKMGTTIGIAAFALSSSRLLSNCAPLAV